AGADRGPARHPTPGRLVDDLRRFGCLCGAGADLGRGRGPSTPVDAPGRAGRARSPATSAGAPVLGHPGRADLAAAGARGTYASGVDRLGGAGRGSLDRDRGGDPAVTGPGEDGGMSVGTLVLLRHGESEWNAKNPFTGWVDVDLTPRGEAE